MCWKCNGWELVMMLLVVVIIVHSIIFVYLFIHFKLWFLLYFCEIGQSDFDIYKNFLWCVIVPIPSRDRTLSQWNSFSHSIACTIEWHPLSFRQAKIRSIEMVHLSIDFVASPLVEARWCLVLYALGVELCIVCYKIICTIVISDIMKRDRVCG